MPIYNPPLTAVDREETRRYAGLRSSVAFPEHLLERACAEAHLHAQPRAVWQIYAYDTAAGTVASPAPLRMTGAVARHLAGAVEVAMLAVTIGPTLEKEAERLFAAGEYTAALLLDAAGTTAVEAAANAAGAFIAAQAARRGLATRSRFSPGYGDWPLTVQPAVMTLADAGAIGLSITASCMLVPRKSITAVIGLAPSGHRPGVAACRDGCIGCTQTNCLARKEL